MLEAYLKVRMSSGEAHYAGNLIDGARILQLFGDVATELLIRRDGDEGLLVAYENVEFLKPVYGGDFIEVRGKIVGEGKTSRKMAFEAYKIIELEKNPERASAARALDAPIIVVRAKGTCVGKKA